MAKTVKRGKKKTGVAKKAAKPAAKSAGKSPAKSTKVRSK